MQIVKLTPQNILQFLPIEIFLYYDVHMWSQVLGEVDTATRRRLGSLMLAMLNLLRFVPTRITQGTSPVM